MLGSSALTRDTQKVKESLGKEGSPSCTEIMHFILKGQPQKDE